MFVNGGRVITTVSIKKSSLIMEETFPNKGILEKLTRKGKSLTFYKVVNKLKP
jgi:hypothetical protein